MENKQKRFMCEICGRIVKGRIPNTIRIQKGLIYNTGAFVKTDICKKCADEIINYIREMGD